MSHLRASSIAAWICSSAGVVVRGQPIDGVVAIGRSIGAAIGCRSLLGGLCGRDRCGPMVNLLGDRRCRYLVRRGWPASPRRGRRLASPSRARSASASGRHRVAGLGLAGSPRVPQGAVSVSMPILQTRAVASSSGRNGSLSGCPLRSRSWVVASSCSGCQPSRAAWVTAATSAGQAGSAWIRSAAGAPTTSARVRCPVRSQGLGHRVIGRGHRSGGEVARKPPPQRRGGLLIGQRRLRADRADKIGDVDAGAVGDGEPVGEGGPVRVGR